MQTIWLIRHAESKSNAGEATDAPNTIGLSALGERQAQRLAERFPSPPDLIVVSPYTRTSLTAAPLLERFPEIVVQEWPLHEFTYLAPAHYAGTTEDQRRGAAQRYWDRCDPHFQDGEGAESFAAFIGRVRQLESRVLAARESFIAVFAHGFVIKAVLWDLMQGASEVNADYMRGFYDLHVRFPVANGAVTPLRFNGKGAPELGVPWLHPYEEEAPERVDVVRRETIPA